MRPVLGRAGLFAIGVSLLFGPAAAQAATVEVGQVNGNPDGSGDSQLTYTALPGETNRVTADYNKGEWVVRDAAAPLTPGRGCRAGDAGGVICATPDVYRTQVLVLLGSTAAQSILGSQVRVLRDRGQVMTSEYCEQTIVTVHPSSLLRAPDEESRERNYAEFVRDLKKVALP
jgi:hypothetical protein